MKLKFVWLSAMLLLFGITNKLLAQNLTISGHVINQKTGEGLSGASIQVKGSKIVTVTDSLGAYSLNIPLRSATLSAQYPGLISESRTVTTPGEINFALKEDTSSLEAVVVIGYGTQKLTTVSGAIATVKAADIERLQPVRAEQALQGTASGVNVIQTGSPGSKPTLFVRGIPSYSGSDALVVVDGVPQSLSDLNSISPSDIESINVLKDAATTAIYGVKGGNGVIVITTKSGRKNMKTQFGLNANYGIQEAQRKLPMLNATEYAAMLNEGSTLAGGNIIFPDLSNMGVGTNWQDQVFKHAPMQNYTASAQGGSDKVTYFLSAGYQSQGGIVGGYDKSRFNRGTFTSNVTFDLTPKLKFILNTSGVILSSKSIQENSFNSILGSAINFDPTVAVQNNVPGTVGDYGFSNLLLSEIYNPLTKLANTFNKTTGRKLYGKFEMQYDIIKDLKLSSRFGYTKYDEDAKSFTPLVFYGPQNVDNSMDAVGNAVAGRHNNVSQSKYGNFNYTWETFANYKTTIANMHNIDVVAGFSMARYSASSMSVTREDVPFNSWDFADFSAATGTTTTETLSAIGAGYSIEFPKKNASFFSRINYDYDGRYLASFNMRRDGSSSFGVDNKYANFYAGSLGWVVSRESFFHSNVINNLKIRGSYGSVGNDNTFAQYYSIITGGPSYATPANSNGYTFGEVFVPGSTLGASVNETLRWETQKQLNIGFDISILSNKLTLNADYYRKDVNGLLFQPTASLYLGTIPVPVANIGSTKSEGIDLTLSYNEGFNNGLKLRSSITFTTVNNKVTETNDDGTAKILGGSYFNGQSQIVTVFQKGYTPGYFYGYKTAGLFQNSADIANWASQPGAAPGDIKFVDINHDGVITADDQTQIGNPFPKFVMGGNFGFDYKNFDFNIFLYASVGNDIYRAYDRNANYTNKTRDILARWTGEGSTNSSKNPRYIFTDPNNNARVSDRFVEDGSFLKVKNVQLGYTFDKKVLGNTFKSVHIYGQIRNALTFTKYQGFDPEIGGGIMDSGVDRGSYPQARTWAFGIDLKF